MTVLELARPGIRSLRPYEAAAQVDDTVRLNANEAPWRSSGESFARPLNRYPEVRPARLRGLLAGRYGCRPEQLLVTRGASEGIDLLIRTFCEPGRDNIVTLEPTFSMYAHYAVVQGAELRTVATDRHADFRIEADAVLGACDEATKLVFLCSPNNPTGTLVEQDVLERILDARNGRSIVVVDEAYIEFAAVTSAVERIGRHENLVVLRTLSKALAYAGARCGAVIGSPALIDMLDAVQAPYALSTPVVESVEQVLKEQGLAEAGQHVAETVRQRERLRQALQGFSRVRRVWPSAANFLLVEVDDAASLVKHCAADKVLVRYFGGSLDDCVRISVGSGAENDRLLASLQRLEVRNG